MNFGVIFIIRIFVPQAVLRKCLESCQHQFLKRTCKKVLRFLCATETCTTWRSTPIVFFLLKDKSIRFWRSRMLPQKETDKRGFCEPHVFVLKWSSCLGSDVDSCYKTWSHSMLLVSGQNTQVSEKAGFTCLPGKRERINVISAVALFKHFASNYRNLLISTGCNM